MWNPKLLTVLAILAIGCMERAPGLRGDGTLAVVELSADAAGAVIPDQQITGGRIPGGTIEDAYCAGARAWDAVGARVRCRREAGGATAGSSIAVVLAAAGEEPLEGAGAWYSGHTGEVHMIPSRCPNLPACAALAAHEIGHALGLGHDAPGNLMAPTVEVSALQPPDVAMFRQAWPETLDDGGYGTECTDGGGCLFRYPWPLPSCGATDMRPCQQP